MKGPVLILVLPDGTRCVLCKGEWKVDVRMSSVPPVNRALVR